MKVIIYSAAFGGRDKDPAINTERSDFIVFSDSGVGIYVPNVLKIPCRAARFFKLFPDVFLHNYDYSVWVDGNMRLDASVDPEELVRTYLQDSDFALFAHPERDCAYEEIQGCINTGIFDPKPFIVQKQKYEADGFPHHVGLYACGFLVRRHTKALKDLMCRWWEEIETYSLRDQQALAYLIWKYKFPVTVIPGNYYKNSYYTYLEHAKWTPYT